MIVGEQKPLDEIKKLLGEAQKVLVVGCGTCVTVCFAGGEKEVGHPGLGAAHGDPAGRRRRRTSTRSPSSASASGSTLTRWPGGRKADVVLSLACGIGVQAMAERFPAGVVLPGLNTTFLGLPQEQGVWEERCQACGDCILGHDRRHLPHRPLLQATAQRAVRRFAERGVRGQPGDHVRLAADLRPVSALGQPGRLIESSSRPRTGRRAADGGPRRIVREDLRLRETEAAASLTGRTRHERVRQSPACTGAPTASSRAATWNAVLRAGHFAVTGELGPPQSADPEVIRKKARLLQRAVRRRQHHRQPDGHRAHVAASAPGCCRCRKAWSRSSR